MLRACGLDFQGSWEDHWDLVEFSYNNSFHASIGMTPFEAWYPLANSYNGTGDKDLKRDPST